MVRSIHKAVNIHSGGTNRSTRTTQNVRDLAAKRTKLNITRGVAAPLDHGHECST
ncbi:hypothetical protein OAN307_c34180 [Octadecabacter antarcticus 307]|uniref:Uncharacterized protein n=1 Tax=Octadecabacter antarcticus 307 TaxID=391626 RepID=M9R9P2_9RHOB|nr:hypothetical protein OAN307_c34180 [Octadecabacter antarcticus 307]